MYNKHTEYICSIYQLITETSASSIKQMKCELNLIAAKQSSIIILFFSKNIFSKSCIPLLRIHDVNSLEQLYL